jgi:gag-polypeptide of LTR copia-type
LAHASFVLLSSAAFYFFLTSMAGSTSFSLNTTAFSYQLPLKLTHENYLSWKFLILPHARGHDLLVYLDGTCSPPAPNISCESGSSPNPDYLAWMRQDQLLLAWLLSFSHEAVVSQVVHCTTSAELWKELHLWYSTQSLARAMDLKMQIHSLQKGHLSMQSYLDQKRSLADKLRLIGSPVSDADLRVFILNGLSIDYDPLVVYLTSRSEAVSFNELTGLLLTHEQRLQKHSLVVTSTSSSSVFPPALTSATSAASSLPKLISSLNQSLALLQQGSYAPIFCLSCIQK